jgi:hypothetical protein
MKICPVGAEFLQTERRKGGRTDIRIIETKSAFHNFANLLETILYEGRVNNLE